MRRSFYSYSDRVIAYVYAILQRFFNRVLHDPKGRQIRDKDYNLIVNP